MITHFRAYSGDGHVLAEGPASDAGVDFSSDAVVDTVVFYSGADDDATVAAVAQVGSSGPISAKP